MDMCSAFFLFFLFFFCSRELWLPYGIVEFQEALWCFGKYQWMLPLIFPICNLYNPVIPAASEIRKHCSVEARVLFRSFVFLMLVLYLTCQCLHYILVFSVKEKKLNKSWQFNFPFLKVVFLAFSFKSLVEIGNWRNSAPSTTPTFTLQCTDLPSADQTT